MRIYDLDSNNLLLCYVIERSDHFANLLFKVGALIDFTTLVTPTPLYSA
jgi:hypothetical protein